MSNPLARPHRDRSEVSFDHDGHSGGTSTGSQLSVYYDKEGLIRLPSLASSQVEVNLHRLPGDHRMIDPTSKPWRGGA